MRPAISIDQHVVHVLGRVEQQEVGGSLRIRTVSSSL